MEFSIVSILLSLVIAILHIKYRSNTASEDRAIVSIYIMWVILVVLIPMADFSYSTPKETPAPKCEQIHGENHAILICPNSTTYVYNLPTWR